MIVDLDVILQAKQPEDIFGYDEDLTENNISDLFRVLRKEVHPDKNGGSKQSTDAFVVLEFMYAEALRRVNANTYGHKYLMRVKSLFNYDLIELFESTPFSDIYTAKVGTGNFGSVLFSAASEPKMNSFMAAEAELIQKLYAQPVYAQQLPNLIESFIYSSKGVERRVNVLNIPEEYVSLETIIEAYPDGLPAKDMAWIYRRLLDVLGYTHSIGYVHGAILPCNILVGLGDVHEVKLINWHCATAVGGKVKAMYSEYADIYPPEIAAKENVTPSVDIYMASRCMQLMLDEKTIERPIWGFLNSCLVKNIKERPHNSWDVRKQFSTLMDKLWTKREYRPLYLQQQEKG